MVMLFTRVLPDEKSAVVLVNWDNVLWAQPLAANLLLLKMIDGPDLTVEDTLLGVYKRFQPTTLTVGPGSCVADTGADR